MVYFVGAGSGAADLITVRGMHMLQQADVIIYAGSLVNPELLQYAKTDCEIHNSAKLTLEEVLQIMQEAQEQGKMLVRLHTGEPSIYGAVREQMDALDALHIPYESCPGVSACFGAAASLNLEYTLPGVSQTLIITRMEGRTGVPQKESIESLAAHQASMAIYLSTGMLRELSRRLMAGGYAENTPAAPNTTTPAPEGTEHPKDGGSAARDAVRDAGDAAKDVTRGVGDAARDIVDGVGDAAKDIGNGVKRATK